MERVLNFYADKNDSRANDPEFMKYLHEGAQNYIVPMLQEALKDKAVADRAKADFENYKTELMKTGRVTVVQAEMMATLLASDKLANDVVFKDGHNLTVEEVLHAAGL